MNLSQVFNTKVVARRLLNLMHMALKNGPRNFCTVTSNTAAEEVRLIIAIAFQVNQFNVSHSGAVVSFVVWFDLWRDQTWFSFWVLL